ncbi:MAG: hypothetical protein A2020_16100 [Lentisphaerae bacterium GWF2_45_14]|nr:MAG: hypothetical protein A2020_16100 [Lentisphaerae bacterium GWF2_45_14]
MKTFVNIFAACAFILLAASCATTENFEEMKTTEATESSKVQKVLLNATNKSDVAYLGLKGGVGEFRIDDITARAVIIYVMSSSCPTCLEAIAGMNALKKLIDERKADIKILVLAAGDSEKAAFEFKKKSAFEFPVFADPDGQIATVLEVDEVPHLIAVVRDEDNAYTIVFDHHLVMQEPEGFLDFLIKNM